MDDSAILIEIVDEITVGKEYKENNWCELRGWSAAFVDLGHRGNNIRDPFYVRSPVYARLNYSRTNLITLAVTSARSGRDGTA